MKKDGFTMIELMIVIAILMIMAAIILPTSCGVYQAMQEETEHVEVISQEEELQQMKSDEDPNRLTTTPSYEDKPQNSEGNLKPL